ncbi:type I methionyl aminopeptidase [Lactobacillus taiwanensis]|jgi:methionine aminopeptidase, type I|uniref:Methionine aminopeptidase n=1 Tax=Lactobacillus taiwanensis TaxID=508451 RepID=A0A256L9I1_9LACO|nr:type I methionyl aminopeptidase [Lactobacillus taiwanensis]MCR1903004.1 type I methionyl aminopeptidase [Lactobacillus taiwanensis]MCR1916371.1 type I methionyl aminopeptidase [Lactobacillus taiwanensis]MRM98578.1 type I methionyl aminopeptidase [Lactobacillus taiwanensis]OYR87202.1 type I methionyl aminopeptidase [Lactobacillus taiwanensis]OYR90074.1 type I methionyl aminopeptidase [Lactobacillus taiwanensis]
MITIKSKRELQGMQKSGRVLAAMFEGLRDVIRPGISTWEIEEFAQDFMKKHGGRLSEQGFEGYKYGTCISVNDEIAHAIPRKDKILKEGDLVSVDVTCNVDGYETDSCTTYGVGKISAEDQKLMDVTKKAMYMGIDQAVVGNRIGDIGSVIQNYVENENGYGDVRELVGHGIQPSIHEDPEVPHWGKAGHGLRLREGMTITVEPMVEAGGDWRIEQKTVSDPNDDWVYYATPDGSKSAQFEHTFAITPDGPKILTLQKPYDGYEKYLPHFLDED